jgi:hypothetical protein
MDFLAGIFKRREEGGGTFIFLELVRVCVRVCVRVHECGGGFGDVSVSLSNSL